MPYIGTLTGTEEIKAKMNEDGEQTVFVRFIQIIEPNKGTIANYEIQTGYLTKEGDGIVFRDDLQTSRLILKKLKDEGWWVVPNDRMPELALFTAEEMTVMTGAFEVRRLEQEENNNESA